MTLASLCLVCVALAAQAKQTPAIQALQHFYRDVHTLRTHFDQVQTGDTGNTLKKASGVFYLKRPGRFRWNYEEPYKESIISDGKTLWTYDKGLQQVTRRPANKALRGTPALLLSGDSDLEKSFNIESRGKRDGLFWVRLVPKSKNGDFKWVRLAFAGNKPKKMILRDHLGDTSRITFSHTKVNETVSSERFDFTPPKGAEVVNGRQE
jgi:outer membrane lipoprotein carrier protein